MKPTFPCLLAVHVMSCAAIAPLAAQNHSTLPLACASIPGNAAVSLPLRWSEGTMQVLIDSTMFPSNFIGQTITGLRLRKPSFLGEQAYPAVTRTLTVRGGFHGLPAHQAGGTRNGNRPANLAVLFGPAPVTTAATAATNPGTAVGEQLFDITLTTPLLVIAGNLLLEFETTDAPLQVSSDHWVDAVWFEDGAETGYAVTVGSGECTTRPEPTQLLWEGATGPQAGNTATLRLTGAPPTVPNTSSVGFAVAWFGLDPQPRAATANFVGYGISLGALDPGLGGCHQWAPIDASWGGLTDQGGNFAVSFPLTAGVTTAGLRIGVQAAWLDTGRSGPLPISVSNGVMLVLNEIAVGNRCSTVFFPGSLTASPWAPNYGMMPVIELVH